MAFIQRYQRAAYRYLLSAVRSADAADELFQELALRFVRGDFRRADPQKGRFRDYLKTSLCHLIVDYHKRQQKQPPSLDTVANSVANSPMAEELTDQQFSHHWREELFDRTWMALETMERDGGQPYFSVLKYRSQHPKTSSAEIARELTNRTGRQPPFTEASIRKLLQRARVQFADRLVEEVARSLGQADQGEIEAELIELDLLDYCRAALERRSGAS